MKAEASRTKSAGGVMFRMYTVARWVTEKIREELYYRVGTEDNV